MRALGLSIVLAVSVLGTAALAQDAAPAKKPKDWSKHMGKLAFTVGYEKGLEESKFTGKPPMLFFTKYDDPWCPKFATRSFSDTKVIELLSGYTPILVDVDAEPEAVEKFPLGMPPALIWLKWDGSHVFNFLGNAPLDLFRMTAEIAHDRAPDPKPPAEGYEPLLELGEKLDAAMKEGKVPEAVGHIAAIRKVRLGAVVQRKADAADAKLAKEGGAKIAEAEAMLAKRKRVPARKLLRQIEKEYGEHSVGKAATALLDKHWPKRKK